MKNVKSVNAVKLAQNPTKGRIQSPLRAISLYLARLWYTNHELQRKIPKVSDSMRLPFIITLLGLLSLLSMNSLSAQPSPEVVLQSVGESLINNDASRLSRYFSDRVELTIVNKTENLSQAQAQYVMDNFFAKFPYKTFHILHRGNANGVLYALAEYRSESGTFDVNIFIKISSAQVTEMRFTRK